MLCDLYQIKLRNLASSVSRTQPVGEKCGAAAVDQMVKMPEDSCIPQYINTSTAVISDSSNKTCPAMVTAIIMTHTT